MTGRRLVVSIDGNAKDAIDYKVAQDGVIKSIYSAYVVADGVIRQYYPPLDSPVNPKPPTAGKVEFSKGFDPEYIDVGDSTRLTFIVDNRAPDAVDIDSIAFIDVLPSTTLEYLDSTAESDNMGGVVVISPANTLRYAGGSLAAGHLGKMVMLVKDTDNDTGAFTNISQELTSSSIHSPHGTAQADINVDVGEPCPDTIEFTTDPITITQQSITPNDADATMSFNALLDGTYTYNNHPEGDVSEQYSNPPLSAGCYLLQWNRDGFPDGTPQELANIIHLIHRQDSIGSSTLLTYVIIGRNDGAGEFVEGTKIEKEVTFIATVIDGNIVWTTTPWNLESITQAQPAICHLIVNQAGNAVGTDVDGTVSEDWHKDGTNRTVPDPPSDPPEYTVTVSLVSGDAPTGNSLDHPHELDSGNFEWQLIALADEEKTCELDVTIADSVSSVTKRVTMHSKYTLPDTNNVWTDETWYLDDDAFSGSVSARVQLNPTGIGEGWEGVVQQYIENWHGAAPSPVDPENYEVKMVQTQVQGTDYTITGDAMGQWHNLSQTRSWIVTFEPQGQELFSSHWWDVSVRFVGQPAVTKQVQILLVINDGDLS